VVGGSNGGVNGFNAIEDEGEVKKGIKGGMMAGRVTARAATVSRRGEGYGADRRAPHGSDVRGRRRLCQSTQSRREYAFRHKEI
jgi:hypothetical protein